MENSLIKSYFDGRPIGALFSLMFMIAWYAIWMKLYLVTYVQMMQHIEKITDQSLKENVCKGCLILYSIFNWV